MPFTLLGPSVGEDIMDAIVEELNLPVDKPCTTYRSRTEAIGSGEDEAMVLRSDRETGDMRGGADLRRRRIVLEAIVRRPGPADEATDGIYIYAVRTLYASTALKSRAIGLQQTDIQWQVAADAQGDLGIAAIAFEFVYAQQTDDPTVAFTGR